MSSRRFGGPFAGNFARRSGAAAEALALAVAVTGCAQILGLEDRTESSSSTSSTSTTGVAVSGTSSSTTSGSSGTSADLDASTPMDDARARDASMRGGDLDATVDDAAVADGGACSAGSGAGTCYIATGLNAPWLIVADETNVYWTERGSASGANNGGVKSCAVTGCTTPTVYASGNANANYARGIAIDATNVYWSTRATTATNGGVWTCPIAGCPSAGPTHLALGQSPYGIAVDATYLYWVDDFDNSVHKVLKGGAGADVVLEDGGDVSDGAINPLWSVGQATVDPSYVYFNDANGPGLYRVPVNGGDPQLVFAGNQIGDWPVVVDPSNVYFAENDFTMGHIMKFAKSDFSVSTDIATGLNSPFSIVLDSLTAHVYWADFGSGSGDGTVGKVATDGGGQTTLQSALADPAAVAVNSRYVFWVYIGPFDSTNNRYIPQMGYVTRAAK